MVSSVLWVTLLFQLGYELKDDQVESLFWRFKAVAEQKKVYKKWWFYPVSFHCFSQQIGFNCLLISGIFYFKQLKWPVINETSSDYSLFFCTKSRSKNKILSSVSVGYVLITCFCFVYQRITDADLRALVSDEVFQAEPIWKLADIQVSWNVLWNLIQWKEAMAQLWELWLSDYMVIVSSQGISL